MLSKKDNQLIKNDEIINLLAKLIFGAFLVAKNYKKKKYEIHNQH